MSEKNGDRFTGFATTFYMPRCYGGRSLVLRLPKKELKKLLNGLLWCRALSEAAGLFGIFQSLHGPSEA